MLNVSEKINDYGAHYCTTQELAEFVTGKEGEDAKAETMNDLEIIMATMTKSRKMRLLATMELLKRLDENCKVTIIHEPGDVARYAMPRYRHENKEHFCVMSLNTKNKIIGFDNIATGTLSMAPVHPREVFEVAIKRHAASIILLHNHPSGDPSPSREDISVTQRLVKAGKIMDIPVLDHIVIGDNRFISIKEKGLL